MCTNVALTARVSLARVNGLPTPFPQDELSPYALKWLAAPLVVRNAGDKAYALAKEAHSSEGVAEARRFEAMVAAGGRAAAEKAKTGGAVVVLGEGEGEGEAAAVALLDFEAEALASGGDALGGSGGTGGKHVAGSLIANPLVLEVIGEWRSARRLQVASGTRRAWASPWARRLPPCPDAEVGAARREEKKFPGAMAALQERCVPWFMAGAVVGSRDLFLFAAEFKKKKEKKKLGGREGNEGEEREATAVSTTTVFTFSVLCFSRALLLSCVLARQVHDARVA